MAEPLRTRIKFCGMTRVEDAVRAAALGVDAIGLVFAPRSPRCVSIEAARAIRDALPPFVSTVALCMDHAAEDVRAIVAALQPTLLQFHGGEDDAFAASFGVPFLKAVAMGAGGDGAHAAASRWPRAAGFVFDGHAPGAMGGSGEAFDWTRWPTDLDRPALLAGGLTPDTVFAAVTATRAWGVDVSSGIEAGTPGVKDADRMHRFVAEVARADAAARMRLMH